MKKKATTRRKARPGASKAPKRRRKASVKGAAPAAPATIMISGIGRYKKSTCHKTKSDAQKSAESKRARGQKARVLKSGTGYCVYARGRSK
jgi:hypothetical protein